MDIREILQTNVGTLTAIQAKFFADDVRAALLSGVPGTEQQALKNLLVQAHEIITGQKVGGAEDTGRQDIFNKIKEAEERGDERTAEHMREALIKDDERQLAIEEQKKVNLLQKKVEEEEAHAATELQKFKDERISARANELLYVNGSSPDYDLQRAIADATMEVDAIIEQRAERAR